MRSVLTALLVCVCVVGTAAGQPPDVAARANKADKVVVAVVEDVSSRFAVNEFGDRLIVSDVWLRVEETLKGAPQNLVPLEVEGGTVGDLTLRVSDLPMLQKGERGVFLVEARGGTNRPSGRGNGILKLDRSNRLAGTGISLADLKANLKPSRK